MAMRLQIPILVFDYAAAENGDDVYSPATANSPVQQPQIQATQQPQIQPVQP